MKTATPPETVQLIPLEKLHISEHNTRQPKPAEASIKELARSLQAEQKTPILVRPHPTKAGHYEIAAGARRRVAAELAALKMLKAIVREYDDDAFEETVLTENLQREDPDPRAEALLLKRLMDRGVKTAQAVAAALGKSETWAARRLRLASLDAGLLKIWTKGQLEHYSADMMEAAAALPAESQKALVSDLKQNEAWKFANARSRRDVEEAIAEVTASLKDATWLRDKRTAVPGCGAEGCASNSAKDGQLFDFSKKESCGRCLNPACFHKRRQKFIDLEYDRLCNGESLRVITRNRITIKGEEYDCEYSLAWQLKAKASKGAEKVITYADGKLSVAYLPKKKESPEAAQAKAAKANPEERAKARTNGLQGKRWLLVRKSLEAALSEAAYDKLTAPIDNLIAVLGLPFHEAATKFDPVDPAMWDYIKKPTAFPVRDAVVQKYGPTRIEFTDQDAPREEALWPSMRAVLLGLMPEPQRVADTPKYEETYRNIAKLIGFPIEIHKRKSDLEILPPKSWGKVDPHTLKAA